MKATSSPRWTYTSLRRKAAGHRTSFLEDAGKLDAVRDSPVFANIHVDFANDSSWTPFVGTGAGMARTCLLYSRRLVRKPLAQGY